MGFVPHVDHIELQKLGSRGIILNRFKKQIHSSKRLELTQSFVISGQDVGVYNLTCVDRGGINNEPDANYWVRPTHDTSEEGFIIAEQPLLALKAGGDGRSAVVQVVITGAGNHDIHFVPGQEPFELYAEEPSE